MPSSSSNDTESIVPLLSVFDLSPDPATLSTHLHLGGIARALFF